MRLDAAKESLRSFDYLLFGAVAALVVVGIVFIDSAAVRSGEWGRTTSWGNFAEKQFRWALISVGVFFTLLVPRYIRLREWSWPFFGAVFLLLAATLVFGVGPARSPGVQRWLEVKIGSHHIADFQPSQVMQVALVAVLARYLMFKHGPRLRHVITVFAITAVPMLIILRQPDLGTALLFVPLPFVMLFAAGARPAHLAWFLGTGFGCVPVMWFLMKSYQKMRFLAWLQPYAYEKNEGWQYIHSRIAVGSGGLFGRGLGHGTQNGLNYLSESHTDFIFSVILEEWGFLGGLFIVFLYFVIILCGLGIAARTREPFGRLLVIGVVSLLATQLFVNMGMNIGLMPITGLTLPFISYGGSSLLASFIAVGIMMNVAVHPVRTLGRDRF